MTTDVEHNKVYEAKVVPHGRLAIWWFLASEIVVFGGLLATYVMARLRHSSWEEFSSQTMTWVGCTNTVLLLTSSLFIVLAHHWAEEKNTEKAARNLMYAIILGLGFVGFKSYEYITEISHGVTPLTNLFWSYYFFITGLHALHVIIGIFINFLAWLNVKKGKHLQRVEIVGLYWHFVDIVWIFVFPLFYVAS